MFLLHLSHGIISDMTFQSPSQVGSTQCITIIVNDDSVFEESLIVMDTFTLSSSQNRVTASGTTTVTVSDNDGIYTLLLFLFLYQSHTH